MIVAVLTLLTVVAISMVITRLAAMALTLTGLSQEAACFQARSALTGVGFTTRESESVVSHPVRRRIIMMLMLTGSISVPTVMATLAVSLFTTFQADNWWWPALLLVAGLVTLVLFGRSRWVERRLNRVLAWGLKRWSDLDVRDYVALLQLQNGFAVTEQIVDSGDWLEDKSLLEAALSHEGVLVLGIQRSDGSYVGAPRAEDRIRAGDTLVLYGRIGRLRELDQRGKVSGETAHRQAVEDHVAESGSAGSADGAPNRDDAGTHA